MSANPGNEAGPQSWWQLIKSCSGTKLDRRNQYVFTAWTFAWALSFVIATGLLKSDFAIPVFLKWLIVGIPVVLAIMTFRSYLRFLHMADEFLQKIQLEGLAIGFGAGVIVSFVYPLLEQLGAPELRANNMLAVMMFGWVAGQLFAMRRYR